MAEEKKEVKEKKKPIKRPALKKSTPKDKAPAPEKKASGADVIAVKQRRSLIMFVASVVLASVIFIPGDMVWLWLHNFVRGVFSMLALFWPALLLFLAVATMLDKAIPKLVFRTSFASGLVVALNACIYIFGFDGEFDIRSAFSDGKVYKGGGALGFIFGAPFVKLFGTIPAKILIILALLVLSVFALGIPVKKLYTSLFRIISEKLGELMKRIKNGQLLRHPPKITDEEYFDGEGYDEWNGYLVQRRGCGDPVCRVTWERASKFGPHKNHTEECTGHDWEEWGPAPSAMPMTTVRPRSSTPSGPTPATSSLLSVRSGLQAR